MHKFHITIIFALFLACGAATAEEASAAQPKAKKIPTVITSDSINIDIAKNIAVFTGNVKADDGKTMITCKKMTILLEDKKTVDASASVEQSKQISRILCEGNVVIVTKEQPGTGSAGGSR